MQRKFRVIPCLESGYTNGYVVLEVLLLGHEYALPENSVLILDNDNIGIGDIVAVDGTILKDVPDITPLPELTEDQIKQERINFLNYTIEEQTDVITAHQAVITKCNEKISAINANTPNITFGSAEIRNAPDNAARLVLLNAAITSAQNAISLASTKIDEANSELTTLQS
jgi:hypothetical protein